MCSVYHESRDLSSVFNGFRDFQQALISDIKRGEQFLGNIILSKRPNKKYEIIDGQQRLSTLLMLLQYIRYVSKGSVPVFDTCDFHVDSFGQFPLALSVNFDIESQTQSVKDTVQESDIFNQLPRYRELWKAIDESGDVDRGTCRVFLQNLSRCTLNVLLDISAEGIGYSIQYFLDVNLKGIRLDTEDIGLPPVFVPTSELVKTVRWHPHSFLGLATW